MDEQPDGFETRGELSVTGHDAAQGSGRARPARPQRTRPPEEDVVVRGDLIIEGDIVVSGDDELEDLSRERDEEGFPTESES